MFKISLLPQNLKTDDNGASHEDYPRKFIDTWEVRAIDDFRLSMKLVSSATARSCSAGTYSQGESIKVTAGGATGIVNIQRLIWIGDNGAVLESRLGWANYSIIKSDTTTSVSGVLGFRTETELVPPGAREKLANIYSSCIEATSGTRGMDAAYRNKLENGSFWRSTLYLNMFEERVGIGGTALSIGTEGEIVFSTSDRMDVINAGYTLY